MTQTETSPAAAPDATHWIAKILDACRAAGATITSSQKDGCYTSRLTYGSPGYVPAYFDPETRAWIPSVKAGAQVTVHRAEWPLVAGSYPPKTTGPTMWDLIAQINGGTIAPCSERAPGFGGVRAIHIYEHPPTLQRNGDEGRGVVLATGRGQQTFGEDERGMSHLATNAAGELELGMFAS